MKAIISFLAILIFALTGFSQTVNTVTPFEKDTFKTSKGLLVITFIGHGTLMIEAGKQVIHVDPVSKEADYTILPKGDIILITHEHSDHFDIKALAFITQSKTKTVVSQSCKGLIDSAKVLLNGETAYFGDVRIEAIPAYNIVNKRNGIAYHPKGEGNGYIITYGGKRIYIGGDTENIPELTDVKNIDVAFLPMNMPYTMTPQMVAEAARSFMPIILYPYHYGDTDPLLLVSILKDTPIKIRIRKMR